MTIEDKAKEFGATGTEWGINWGWAKGFTTQPKAQQFVAWLESEGHEHRGVYPDGNGEVEAFAVRYR